MIFSKLYIKKVGWKGRGVFCETDLDGDVMIEESPVIVMSKEERVLLDQTLLHDYIFEWGEVKDRCCMAMGYVPVYNHSYESNCEYFMDFDRGLIQIKTVRDIKAGEELTINYNGNWNDDKKLWFEVRD